MCVKCKAAVEKHLRTPSTGYTRGRGKRVIPDAKLSAYAIIGLASSGAQVPWSYAGLKCPPLSSLLTPPHSPATSFLAAHAQQATVATKLTDGTVDRPDVMKRPGVRAGVRCLAPRLHSIYTRATIPAECSRIQLDARPLDCESDSERGACTPSRAGRPCAPSRRARMPVSASRLTALRGAGARRGEARSSPTRLCVCAG